MHPERCSTLFVERIGHGSKLLCYASVVHSRKGVTSSGHLHRTTETNLWCRRITTEGVTLVIDKLSMEFVKGATVEYAEDLMSSSFRVCLVCLSLSRSSALRAKWMLVSRLPAAGSLSCLGVCRFHEFWELYSDKICLNQVHLDVLISFWYIAPCHNSHIIRIGSGAGSIGMTSRKFYSKHAENADPGKRDSRLIHFFVSTLRCIRIAQKTPRTRLLHPFVFPRE